MFRRGEDDRHDQSVIEAREVRTRDGAGDVTVIGRGATLEGTVVSAGSLRIDGEVRGKINAEGDVTISSQSGVEADISARNVIVAGRFKGNIVAKSKAELSKGGHVEGNITSRTLVIAEGASFSGQSIMGQQADRGTAQRAAEAQAVPQGAPERGTTERDQAPTG